MKIKMILAILFAILMLSGCSSHEAPAEPESPDQKQEEHLQETDHTKDDGSDEQTMDLPAQQDEPREEVVNTESPAVEKEPDSDTSDVAPKPEQKPSAPEEKPSLPEQKPSTPTEPEDNEEKDEPSVPSEPTVPSQPDLPDDPVQEKPETEGKEDDQNSETSTSYPFLRAIMPSYSVISVGGDNSYGHPTDAVISRLEDAGSEILRTDLRGTIIMRSDGENISYVAEKKDEPGQELVTDGYIGNTNSKKFHRSDCANLPAEKNRVYFNSRQEAVDAIYQPCGNCNP